MRSPRVTSSCPSRSRTPRWSCGAATPST
jgi:hypothetical protein